MKKIKTLMVLALIIMIGTTTVYAYSNNLVKGVRNTSNLDIEYTNVISTSKNGTATLDNTTGVSFTANLEKPGDTFEFTVDMVNKSNMDAKVDQVVMTELTEQQQRYLSYNVTYVDGNTITTNDVIKSGETKTLKITLDYKYDITADDLPTEDENIDLSFNIVMVEEK